MEVHAKRVLDMLEKLKEPCSRTTCPGKPHYDVLIEKHPCAFWLNNPCPICHEFSGRKSPVGCPCLVLGKERTVKRAWLKLEEMGFI